MTTTIEDDGLRAILAAAEKAGGREWFTDPRPTDDGLALIDDGTRSMYPINCEWPQAQFVALANPQTITAIITELLSLRSSPAVDGVRVKPLVWRELTADRGDGAREPNGDWEAETPLGFYEIEMIWVGEIAVWGLTYGTGNGYIGGDWHSPDDAKAAAQADYETRVRSALSPTSDRASVVEAEKAEPTVDGVLRRAGPMYPGPIVGNHINGDIYEDRKGRFADGTNVTTSKVKEVRGDVIVTGNSVYRVEWYDADIFALAIKEGEAS